MRKIMIPGLFMIISVFAKTQTVDEIINKNVEAMGGKEKIMSLNTVKQTAENLIINRKHMIGFRVDLSGNPFVLVTQTKGWDYKQGVWVESPENLFKARQKELDLQGPFLNYKEKGTIVEFDGKEILDGEECYKLKATFKNGNITTYCINVKTNLIVKRSTGDNYTLYSNYKKNADGFVFAYTSVAKNGTVTNFEKIETNIEVDDNIFKTN